MKQTFTKETFIAIFSFLILSLGAFAQDNNELLYKAVAKTDKSTVEKLINEGADVNYIKQSGPWMKVSLLITAINNKGFGIAKLLVEKGADINWKDGFKTSAILYAANTGSKEFVEYLLTKGADINDNDGQGNTVLTAAKESKNQELINFVEAKLKQKK